MRKFLLVTLAVLITFVAGLWWLLADANRFKPQLVELIETKTGLIVAIDGDLTWRLWPPVQLVAQRVRADWSADAPEPMLAVRTLRLDADLWRLLARNPKLVIEGVAVEGLRANLVQHGEHANWMPPDRPGGVGPPLPIPPPSENGTADPAKRWGIAEVALSDAVIDYAVDREATQISIDALRIRGIAPTRQFPLNASLLIKRADSEIPVTIATQVTFDAGVERWQFDDTDISGVYGRSSVPFRLKGNARLNTRALTFEAEKAHLDIGATTASFDVAASEKRIDLTNVELRYGPSIVTGKVGTPLGSKLNIALDLTADRFEVPARSRTALASLGAGTFAAVAFAAPPIAIDTRLDEPLLPIELIRTVDWSGKISVAQLLYDGATFGNTSIVSSNDSANVDVAVDLPEFFGGSATTQVKVDASTGTPQWSVVPKLNHVDSQALLAWLGAKYDWDAFFIADGELHMRGNTHRDLISTLAGRSTFDGGQGVIDITQIKNAALAVAKIAGGSGKVEAWPDRLKYQRFTGNWDVNGTDQAIEVALDNLTLRAKGKFDTIADDMDIKATVTVTDDPKYNSFKVGSALMGLPLPLRCNGSIAAAKCGADEDGTRQLIAQALSGKDPQMKERLDKAIDEKVPEQYRDAARELLEMLNKNGKQPKSP